MKKIVFLLTLCLLLSGCSLKNLNCEKVDTSSEDLKLKQSLDVKFKGKEVVNINMHSVINVSGVYKKYTKILEESITEEFKNLKDDKAVNITSKTDDNKVDVYIYIDLKNMSDESKKKISLINTKQSIANAKKELEKQGYKCKEK